jgi:hypothetical protein
MILFICGCGHTGTSLVANMFAARSDVFIPTRETGTFLDDNLATEKWNVLKAEWQHSEKPHLAEKTPRHIRKISSIREAVPGAKFLIMVRDGRDVAASFLKRFESADTGRRRWVRDTSIALNERTAEDVLVLRYEDLIVDPIASLRSVCDFARLSFSLDMVEYHTQERLWFGQRTLRKGSGADGEEHNAFRNWQINQPLFDGRGQWEELLSKQEVEHFSEGRAQRLMRQFGYIESAQESHDSE